MNGMFIDGHSSFYKSPDQDIFKLSYISWPVVLTKALNGGG